MTTAADQPVRRFPWKKVILGTATAGIITVICFGWYITTNSFQDMVRRRLVAELNHATGGRAELGAFHTSPLWLRIEVQNVTIHGNEGPGELPLVHVNKLVAQAKIISILGAEMGFHSLVLDHPVIHIISRPDGSTNLPQPESRSATPQNALQKLFAFSIGRLDVRSGELIWNDQKTPLDFTAQNVSAQMDYLLLSRRYQGQLLIGKADTKFKDFRPVSWTMQMHFNLSSHGLEIESLKADSGKSNLEITGRMENFQQPKIEFAYAARIDLAEAAAVSHTPNVRRGTFELGGSGVWNGNLWQVTSANQNFSVTGKLSLKDVEARLQGVLFKDASFAGKLDLGPQDLRITSLQGGAFDGSLTGELRVENWQSTSIPDSGARQNASLIAEPGISKTGTVKPSTSKLSTAKPVTVKSGGPQKGALSLRWKDVSVAEVESALNHRAQALALPLAGSSAGKSEIHWSGTPLHWESSFTADVTPDQSRKGRLPLRARMAGDFDAAAQDLELSQFDAFTPGSEIHASGRLSAHSALRLVFRTSNLKELQPVLTDLGYGSLPGVFYGQASFSGSVSGRLSNPNFAGNIEAQNFDLAIPHHALRRPLHVDSLAAFVQFSPDVFVLSHAAAHTNGATLHLDLNADLQNGKLRPDGSSQFQLRAEIENASAEDMLGLGGYRYPITGNVLLHLQAAGTVMDPHGNGHIELTRGSIYGEPAQKMTADLHFSGGEASMSNLDLTSADASFTGDASYRVLSRAFRFHLRGSNFELARIPQLHNAQVAAAGKVDFTAQGSGNPSHPSIQAELHVRNLALQYKNSSMQRLGDFLVHAKSEGTDLHLSGGSQPDPASLSVVGDIHLHDDWPSALDLKFARMNLTPALASYANGRGNLQGLADGELHIQGPLRHWENLSVTGNVNDVALDVEKVKLQNNGPIRFTLSNQALQLEQFHLFGDRTDFSASGTVHLTGARELQGQAEGSANLRLIQTFNHDFTSSGTISAKMKVSGTVSQPLVQGRIQISRGSIAYIDLPSALSDINGTLIFDQHGVKVESLVGHTGGGTVTFSGYANLYDRQMHFDLGLVGQDVRLRYPPGVSSTADTQLRFAGTPAASTLSGDITITKLSVTPGFDFGDYFIRSAQTGTLPQTNPLLNKIRLDVHVTTTPELQMQTAAVRLSGEADLNLRGTAARPALLGRAGILEGEIYFNGAKYRLERGDVIFVNPASIQPVVDLQASTQVRDYDITLDVTGQPDKLNITYRSEPPLPPADIVALLALGHTQEEAGQVQGQTPFSQEASNTILAEALNAAVNNRVQRLFGGSRIKIDPAGLSTETSLARGPAVTIEQQVAGNITLSYSTNISQTSQQVIQAQYNVSRDISIDAVRDQNGVVSIDITFRRRKK